MQTIEVDFDVFKALTMKRESEEVTYNDVLRKLLDLPVTKKRAGGANTRPQGEGWRPKGVFFPNGTDFRARYKGEMYSGRVENGKLVVNGKSYGSPSGAAVAITNNPVNGWDFWQAKLPGYSAWRVMNSFRN